MKKIFNYILDVVATAAILFGANACNKYLDVVPDDGIATIDMAFNLRSSAIRYLATCYSYMPHDGAVAGDSAFLTGDELWDTGGSIGNDTSDQVPKFVASQES